MVPYAPTIERQTRNVAIMAELRASGGRTAAGNVLVILHTIGARSGREREIPVCVREDGDDLVVVASAGGQPTHPQWYSNLVAHPEIVVEYMGESFRVQASVEQNSRERDHLFSLLNREVTGLYEYQDRCRNDRQIPIVRLQRLVSDGC